VALKQIELDGLERELDFKIAETSFRNLNANIGESF